VPYKSDKQRAWMHIHEPAIAKRWDAEIRKKKSKGGSYDSKAVSLARAMKK
jgi:hypothetical protein